MCKINYSIKLLGVLLSLCFSSVTTAAPVSFDVVAAANSSTGGIGLNTGLSFNAGDLITGFVDSNDLWSAGILPRWSNADGLVTDLFATGADESGESAGTLIGTSFANSTQNGFSAPFGSLVGEINNVFFLLGTNFNLNAPEAGTLSLYFWDENAFDNTQLVTVSIEDGKTVVPIPAAVWLFGAGLIGLIGIRKKTVSSS